MAPDDFKRYVRQVLEYKKMLYKRLLDKLDFTGTTYKDYKPIHGQLITQNDFPEFNRHTETMKQLLAEMKLLLSLLRKEQTVLHGVQEDERSDANTLNSSNGA